MTEFWLSGPVDGVPPALTPAAHAILQVREDVPQLLSDLTVEQLWRPIGQSASIGYHAIHLAGATDRLMTYARGEQLTEAQLADVRGAEKSAGGLDSRTLVARVERAMDVALEQLRATPEFSLPAPREVGRKLLPSTTLGLISHAAEHAYRHAGQIATLTRALSG
jgi:uncharacterized damage-inducible protein DinB